MYAIRSYYAATAANPIPAFVGLAGVDLRNRVITVKQIQAPLPDVAVHVVEAERVRREGVHRGVV